MPGDMIDAGDVGPPIDGAVGDTGPRPDAGDVGAVPDTNVVDDASCMPTGPETCDGTDEDCDGSIDEAVTRACGSDIGACEAGLEMCTDGVFGACLTEVGPAATEDCNGIDDTCDGTIDEGCTCTDGETQSCGSDVGECAIGTQTCAGGAWGACVGEIGPTAETCNGLDDSCDGTVDETCSCTDGDTQSCGSDIGACVAGIQTCAMGAWGACVGEVGPAIEACNAVDDSCDGTIDEGCTCTDGATQSCGSDVGECTAGTQTCAMGAWGACVGEVGPAAEACNALDDSCDGTVDEGCSCVDGTMQPCGSDVGECSMGTQTCASGAWGTCAGDTAPTTETCNMLDDDCDGSTDEAFVLGGMCDGADADMCNEGTLACDAAGGVSCTDTSADNVETCNAMDDDCDGTVDDGFMVGTTCDGPDADMCNEGAIACNATGGASCSDASGDSVETCNGMDDDCDGNVDEGNPGGGVACAGGGADVGACISRTACVGGTLICRGTFVSAAGLPTNPGTPMAPLPSIVSAQANAAILGGGADVCVCDTAAAGASTFTENVTMVEGTSVLGGYDCGTWTITAGRTTAIQDTDADGVSFPAGITSATVLDRMTVDGFDVAGGASSTAAITITDSSPTLSTVTARAGDAATAIGLRVVESPGALAAPAISNGAYTSVGVAGGTAIAVSLEASSPRFTTVAIGGGAAISGAAATTSYGVRCTDCGGTTFNAGSVNGGASTTNSYGFHGTGSLAGLTAMTTTFGGGSTSGTGSSSVGIRLEGCAGDPTFTSSNTNGGFSGAGTATMTTRTAILTSGVMCAPVIDGGRHFGCERGNTCIGIQCEGSSACVVRNAALAQGTAGNADTAAHGMRCLTSGCGSITASTLLPGNLTGGAVTASGLDIDGATPFVDDCFIAGPGGSSSAGAAGRYNALYLQNTGSTVSNSIIRDVNVAGAGGSPPTFPGVIAVVRYDQTPSSGPAALAPTLVNNTIEYLPCTTCGVRVGLLVNNMSLMPLTAGTVRNNIIRNQGAGGTTNPVIERNANSDLAFFQNNSLWDPTAANGGARYLDEGATPLGTAMQINTMMMGGTSGGNLVADCMPNASWHIPNASMCRNAGTSMSCPRTDYDGQARPNEAVCDIGADEFYP